MNKDHYHYKIGPFWSIFSSTSLYSCRTPFASTVLSSTVNCGAKVRLFNSFGGHRDKGMILVSKNNFRELCGEATYCYSIRGISYVGDGGKKGGESNNLSDNGTGGMDHILFLDAFNTPALILKTQC